MEVPDGAGVGVGGSSIPIGTFPEDLIGGGGVACLGIRLSHGSTICVESYSSFYNI